MTSRSLKSRVVTVVVVVVVAVVWILAGFDAIEVPYLFSGRDATRLVVADEADDCRMAGRDWGERCDAAADISSVTVWRAGQQFLMAEIEVSEAPTLGPDVEWTADFYAETANAFTDHGLICGLSNAIEGADPATAAVSYAREFRFSTDDLGSEACEGWLQGSTARFRIDVTGQPPDVEVRLVGAVRLEFPGDPNHLGSEDDFLVKTTLADLPR